MMLMTILIKIRLKSKHHSFSEIFENKWTVDRPWTPRGTHILARGKDILARGTDIPARGQQRCATFRIYSAQSPDQTFSTAPKN